MVHQSPFISACRTRKSACETHSPHARCLLRTLLRPSFLQGVLCCPHTPSKQVLMISDRQGHPALNLKAMHMPNYFIHDTGGRSGVTAAPPLHRTETACRSERPGCSHMKAKLLLLPSRNTGARDCKFEPCAHSCCCCVGWRLHCWDVPGLDIGQCGPACPSLLLGVMLMSPSRGGTLAHLENAESICVAPPIASKGAPAPRSANDAFLQLV